MMSLPAIGSRHTIQATVWNEFDCSPPLTFLHTSNFSNPCNRKIRKAAGIRVEDGDWGPPPTCFLKQLPHGCVNPVSKPLWIPNSVWNQITWILGASELPTQLESHSSNVQSCCEACEAFMGLRMTSGGPRRAPTLFSQFFNGYLGNSVVLSPWIQNPHSTCTAFICRLINSIFPSPLAMGNTMTSSNNILFVFGSIGFKKT